MGVIATSSATSWLGTSGTAPSFPADLPRQRGGASGAKTVPMKASISTAPFQPAHGDALGALMELVMTTALPPTQVWSSMLSRYRCQWTLWMVMGSMLSVELTTSAVRSMPIRTAVVAKECARAKSELGTKSTIVIIWLLLVLASVPIVSPKGRMLPTRSTLPLNSHRHKADTAMMQTHKRHVDMMRMLTIEGVTGVSSFIGYVHPSILLRSASPGAKVIEEKTGPSDLLRSDTEPPPWGLFKTVVFRLTLVVVG